MPREAIRWRDVSLVVARIIFGKFPFKNRLAVPGVQRRMFSVMR